MADLFEKVNCTYCQDEINGVRIQCCACTDFDICLQCFCSGAEIGPHKNDHPYKFVDYCAVSIFGGKGTWTGREELQLLDAMEHYGFGNWEFVSEQVQTRTPEEVKEEYISRYLDGNIGKATWAEIADKRPLLADDVPEDKGPLSPAVIARLPPLDATPEEAQELNYMFHRDDFEWEHDMGAEELVSRLQYSPDDNEVEISLKLLHVDTYIRRLRERARRKRVVRDYQLVAKFYEHRRQNASKKTLTKDQKSFRERMKIFSQFMTAGEHERLIQSIERERELRYRLSELLRYRSLGLSKQQDVLHYEQHVAYQKQQEQQKQQKQQKKAGSSGYTSAPPEIQTKSGKVEESQSTTIERSVSVPEGAQPESGSSKGSNGPDEEAIVAKSPMPMSQMLSKNEIQLCESLNILPMEYIIIKSLIIKEHLTSKGETTKTQEKTKEISSVEDVIKQYLSFSGWLPDIST